MCDEVECVEKTLLKRRAELREADRLLLEARSCISSSRLEVTLTHTHTMSLFRVATFMSRVLFIML